MSKLAATYKNFYFLGIGGIGMSALAQYYQKAGYQVAGYDRTRSEITDLLQQKDIPVVFEDHTDALPGHWKIAETAVVYTPAVNAKLALYQQLQDLGIPFYKRSAVLGWISQEIPTLAIAGTHGKTTTTAIVTHVFKSAGYKVLGFIGGIASNYGSNVVMDDEPDFLVVEADEFDRSFLQLHPKLSIITSVDPDHLDIYTESGAMQEAFNAFAKQTQDKVFAHQAVQLESENVAAYDTEETSIEDLTVTPQGLRVALKHQTHTATFTWHMAGRYNALNALAAFCLATEIGIKPQIFTQAMESFTGVKRRFETVYRGQGITLIDDYAHHPTELEALRDAVFEMFPDQRVTIAFQPHLYSRTRDFMDAFAAALGSFHEVLLLPIYPAREEPIPGVNSEALLQAISQGKKRIVTPFELLNCAADFEQGVLLMVGAGDIAKMVDPVKRILEKRVHA